MAELNYSAEGKETIKERTLLPPGWYNAIITETQIKAAKNNPDSQYLELKIVIDNPGGPYDETVLTEVLNLFNTNPKAVAIADKAFASLVKALAPLRGGQESITDSDELCSLPFNVKVGVKPAEGQYQPKNIIQNYAPHGPVTLPSEEALATPEGAPAHGKHDKKPVAAGASADVAPWDRV